MKTHLCYVDFFRPVRIGMEVTSTRLLLAQGTERVINVYIQAALSVVLASPSPLRPLGPLAI
jgi:hypothetical protein